MNDFLAQLVFVFVSNMIIGGAFLYVGAIVSGIKDGTFEKAFWVNLQGSILSFLAILIIFLLYQYLS
ncbi:membrane protein [Beggiatoa sp. PS]|nr:membrane protein [Beggiatoa sp. PS]